MYESFFGLTDSPFYIAPDPRFLYMSERHQEALAHLLYGLTREGGFILLTGEVGTGKTTICRKFLQNLPESTKLAFVLYPKLSALELLATICDELGIACSADASTKQLVDRLNQHLLAAHGQGKNTALIIDEAQNLTSDVLEQLRLLTNLETDQKKLLQIILLGQPELNELLQRPELRQLSQRVTARYHLVPLGRDDVKKYIDFRLGVAGCFRTLFDSHQVRRIHEASRGIPRLINLICDRSLLGAYSRNEQTISGDVVSKAIREVLGSQTTAKWWQSPLVGISALVLVGVFALVGMQWKQSGWPLDGWLNKGLLAEASDGGGDEDGVVVVDEPEGVAAKSIEQQSPAAQTEALALLVDDAKVAETGYLPFEQYQLDRNNITKAYQILFEQWQLETQALYRSEAENCRWAAQQGLQCLHRSGNWRTLLQLNRPVVLNLMNSKGVRFRATFTDITEDRIATVQLDGEEHRLALATLDQYWRGQYSLIWKVPPYQSMVIEPGSIQDRSEWLQQQFDLRDALLRDSGVAAEDMAAPPKPKFTTLKERVKHFQRAVGIQPDGIPGTITIIMLNSWTQPDTPLLLAKDKS